MIENSVGRSPLVAPGEQPPQAAHAALLVDFDNVTMGIRSDLQTQLRKLLNSDIIRGKVSVQRAYADWRRYPQYIVPLTEASIDLIFAPAVGANKKNATDIRLAIDALELVFTRPEIGTFILLSGDSDFSALVLKLREYGKFVIGVGIRESSSDLLVQNCDEYYSYNELTGLSRTGDVEIVRHDPWELVVEAIQKMLRNGDVMRSDRLKQVMQSIDPNFSEKDAGCNRFSKFVVEAEKRGLLCLTKMENGQHAVEVGPNANIQIDHGTPTETKTAKPEAKPSPQRRKRSTRARPERDPEVRTLTLSESLELLKRALVADGALGDDATVADKARERMIEIHGNDSDPVFEAKRFQRMLRQAHDADVIELIKDDGDDYMLKLSAAAVVEMESKKSVAASEEATANEQQEVTEETSEDTEVAAKPKRKTRKKSTTARKSTRSRTGTAAKKVPDDETTASAEVEEKPSSEEPEKRKRTTRRKATTTRKTTRSRTRKTEEDAPEDVALSGSIAADVGTDSAPASEDTERPKRTSGRKGTAVRKTSRTRKVAKEANEEESGQVVVEATVKDPQARLNARFRKGSRSVTPKPPVTEEPADSDAKAAVPATPTPKMSTTPRTLGARTGSRGAKRPEKQPEAPKLPKQETKPPKQEVRPPRQEVKSPTSPAAPKTQLEPVEKAVPSSEPDEDGAGLFRKVTAAFQRAMGTVKDDNE